ncbi:hypothetical protein ADS79_27745 [Brevibacillus reuszeri]|uniref:Uncharacterized protein n=2 Tax=Brevibacillus reuszeri TaxID=54915 RepID=A0A0K9YLS6_9BACL|nr:hypothetical protein ADS79_27745 [Brevibacillus reuszeri]
MVLKKKSLLAGMGMAMLLSLAVVPASYAETTTFRLEILQPATGLTVEEVTTSQSVEYSQNGNMKLQGVVKITNTGAADADLVTKFSVPGNLTTLQTQPKNAGELLVRANLSKGGTSSNSVNTMVANQSSYILEEAPFRPGEQKQVNLQFEFGKGTQPGVYELPFTWSMGPVAR